MGTSRKLLLTLAIANRVSSAILPMCGAGPAVLSAAAGKEEDQLLHLSPAAVRVKE